MGGWGVFLALEFSKDVPTSSNQLADVAQTGLWQDQARAYQNDFRDPLVFFPRSRDLAASLKAVALLARPSSVFYIPAGRLPPSDKG